jgi:hypothetical protein
VNRWRRKARAAGRPSISRSILVADHEAHDLVAIGLADLPLSGLLTPAAGPFDLFRWMDGHDRLRCER